MRRRREKILIKRYKRRDDEFTEKKTEQREEEDRGGEKKSVPLSRCSNSLSLLDIYNNNNKEDIIMERRGDDFARKLAELSKRTTTTTRTRFRFSKRAPDSETRERDFVSLGTTSSGDNNRPNWMRENHADLPILEKGEMDHSWREDGVRDATETSERANRCDASVRGDFCF